MAEASDEVTMMPTVAAPQLVELTVAAETVDIALRLAVARLVENSDEILEMKFV